MNAGLLDKILAPRMAAGLAASCSAALLVAVYAMQYLGGLAPCPLCLLQRWPHAAVVALGLAAALVPVLPTGARRAILALIAAGFATTAAIGAYHAGVEYGWLSGPTACTGTVMGDTVEELRRNLMAAAPVRCDEVPWALFGISLAGYNALVSAALAGLAGWAAIRRPGAGT